jgi:hypothetical protein
MGEKKSIPSLPSQDGPSRDELEQHIRARAWKDDTFRQEFLADPKAVLQRDFAAWFSNETILADLSIKVVEEEEQSMYFVLPPNAPDYIHDIQSIGDLETSSVSSAEGTGNYTCTACTGFCTHTVRPCMRAKIWL